MVQGQVFVKGGQGFPQVLRTWGGGGSSKFDGGAQVNTWGP